MMSTAARRASITQAGEFGAEGLEDGKGGRLWLPARDGGTLLQLTNPS